MVGLVAAYEARHSLWTICRAIPRFSLWMVPMIATVHLLQPRFGLGLALAGGWVAYLSLLIPFTARHWRQIEEEIE
jgi:predicted lysophospholipase L1 biosynthesis ABC-type transport system permease subunit